MRTQAICLALTIVLLCPFASAQWVHTNLPDSINVDCFAVCGTNLFAGTDGDGVFLSTNNGTSWTAVNGGFPRFPYDTTLYAPVYCLALSGQHIFAGTYDCGVVSSTDNGTTWTSTGLTNNFVWSLAVSGLNVFAGTDGDGVLLSTNNGTSWTAVNSGLPVRRVEALAVSGTNLMAVINMSGPTNHTDSVFLTTNSGTSWIPATAGWTHPYITAFAACGEEFFATTFRYGVFHRTINDTVWTESNSVLGGVNCLGQTGSNLFTGTLRGGVFVSTNEGTTWTAVNEGLPKLHPDTTFFPPINCFVSSGQYLFASTVIGVWRRPVAEMTTNVESNTLRPTTFALSQNFPNPFNPTTTIKYELPKASEVKLSVYDLLGREVSVLVNEEGDAGVHEVVFNGSALASGVYLYRLTTGAFTQTRKMIVVK